MHTLNSLVKFIDSLQSLSLQDVTQIEKYRTDERNALKSSIDTEPKKQNILGSNAQQRNFLHSVVILNQFEIVENIKHCDFKSLLEKQNEFGNTPLHLSALFKRRDLFSEFIWAGADPAIKNKEGLFPHQLLENQTDQTEFLNLLYQKLAHDLLNSRDESLNKNFEKYLESLDLPKNFFFNTKIKDKSILAYFTSNQRIEFYKRKLDIFLDRLEYLVKKGARVDCNKEEEYEVFSSFFFGNFRALYSSPPNNNLQSYKDEGHELDMCQFLESSDKGYRFCALVLVAGGKPCKINWPVDWKLVLEKVLSFINSGVGKMDDFQLLEIESHQCIPEDIKVTFFKDLSITDKPSDNLVQCAKRCAKNDLENNLPQDKEENPGTILEQSLLQSNLFNSFSPI